MTQLALTPSDVIKAIQEQNLLSPAGRIGASPSPADQRFTFTVSAPRPLRHGKEEFENIIVRETLWTARKSGIRDVGACRARLSKATTPSGA